ncbi:MAG: FkbM family methyltransferase [Blastomonas sp.]|jgi:FkbM family methyltransferase
MAVKADISPSGRFLLPKKIVGSVILHPIAGRLIGWLFNNRIPHRGQRIAVAPGGDPVVNAVLFWGIYESAELRYVLQYLDGKTDVIELGSSIGGVSCVIATRLGDRRLICVEANSSLLGLLRQNLDTNAPGKTVEIVHGAIDYSGKDHIEFSIGSSNLSSHVGSEGKVESVPTLTLGSIQAAYNVGDYALVCDIEGAEAALFDNDQEALQSCQTIIIELHTVTYGGISYDPDKLIDMIAHNTGMALVARYGEVCVFSRRDGNKLNQA